MTDDEGLVHIAVRRFLKCNGWQLVAGQFPGGSDDECYALHVVDPAVACDNRPDPRRHSNKKLVPDLLTLKGNVALIIEMKLGYSANDETKLESLLAARRTDSLAAMCKFGKERGVRSICAPETLTLIPALGFMAGTIYPRNAKIRVLSSFRRRQGGDAFATRVCFAKCNER